MLFVISASPLIKAFLPEWQDKALENPDILNDSDTPFTFDVPRNCGAFRMEFNKPVEVVVKDHDGRVLQKDTQNLYEWLIGGAQGYQFTAETDCYGIVAFDPKQDLVSNLDRIAMLETAADPKKGLKELEQLQKSIREGLRAARMGARIASEARIMRAMKITANNLLAQWRLNEEQKLGKHVPSISEHLSVRAYKKEIESKNAKILQSMGETAESLKATLVR